MELTNRIGGRFATSTLPRSPAWRMQAVMELLSTYVRIRVTRGRGQRRNRRNRPALAPVISAAQARRLLEWSATK